MFLHYTWIRNIRIGIRTVCKGKEVCITLDTRIMRAHYLQFLSVYIGVCSNISEEYILLRFFLQYNESS